MPAGAGFPGSRDVGACCGAAEEDGRGRERGLRSAAGIHPRPGDEPGAGQERYADHERDGRTDQVMSLMDAANHECSEFAAPAT